MKYLPTLTLILLILPSISVNAIVNGTEQNDSDWPYFVSLRNIEIGQITHHRCGGTYIGEGLIMTAAHCLKLVPGEGGSVACMGGSEDAADNNCYLLTTAIPHPEYNPTSLEADLGLYKMQTTPYQYPSPLLVTAEQDEQITGGELLQYIGLGSTSWQTYTPSTTLQGTQLQVLDGDSCSATAAASWVTDISKYICTDTIDNIDSGVAPGDSGSPALVLTEDGWRYAALVSSGLATRLGVYLDWIEGTSSELSAQNGLYFETDTYWVIEVEESLGDELSPESNPTENLEEQITTEKVEFVLKNKSHAQISQTFELPEGSPFSITGNSCDTISALQSCTLTLEFTFVDIDEVTSQLSITQESGNSLSANLTALRLQPLLASVDWQEGWTEVGDSIWLDSEHLGVETTSDHSNHQLLNKRFTGPASLSFSAQVETESGNGSLQVRVDDALAYQMSGECDAQDLVVDIPEGEHSVQFEYFSSTNSDEADYVELYDINYSESSLSDGTLSCSYRSASSKSSSASSSGGGSLGGFWIMLLILGVFSRKLNK